MESRREVNERMMTLFASANAADFVSRTILLNMSGFQALGICPVFKQLELATEVE